LEVLDDGTGFDPLEYHDRHFGLVLMRERVAVAGGVMEISSRPGSGVRLSASFPEIKNG
jgi:two-component system sensor histidine kinase DegS